ncbi:hypothetical protein A1332_15805 [Methylomonas methanica]|uniref:Uncharacterized protein n=1 Tax=Methylomonas methanica TaxID=421 RepID=A0A177MD72_METMH|nr:hypothetical protein A1332_15805 [Methylomonas methanica]
MPVLVRGLMPAVWEGRLAAMMPLVCMLAHVLRADGRWQSREFAELVAVCNLAYRLKQDVAVIW